MGRREGILHPGSARAFDAGRRRFLKGTGGAALALSQLGGAVSAGFVDDVLAARRTLSYDGPEDLYRETWQWDRVTWGSHTNICLPGGCSFHVYVKDGMVWREEQAAHNAASNPNYPDYNPLGCQKGCGFHANIYGEARLRHPLKRVGERGEGRWQRITWDEAITEIAGSIIDAIEEQGPDGFVLDPPHMHLGSVGWVGSHRMTAVLGGVAPDLNIIIGDFLKGTFDTIGKQHIGYSADNLFDAELIFLTCSNWSYTMPAIYHFLTEARYNGTELVSIAPDYNPTSIACDYHAPIRQGTDAAFWLGIAQVIIAEGLVDEAFVREQTDLPLLVRLDTGRFLRQTELEGSGREDQLYVWDPARGAPVRAPRATLKLDAEPALEGRYRVRLADGAEVEVTPVFALLKARLDAEYTPDQAAAKCGVHASLIRKLGHKVGTRRTCSYVGFTTAKIFHGDLGERALILAMALSGNWGKPGTGWNCWAMPADHVEMLLMMDRPVKDGGLEAFRQMEQGLADKLRAEDPEITDELISVAGIKEMTRRLGSVPPVFFLYHHCGYKDLYDNQVWQDPALRRSFSEYLDEAVKKGWWGPEHLRPAPDKTPRVLMITASNPIRRVRSAALKYPEVLFPKLKMLFAIEPRMSSTAMYCDIVLPAAWYYEKQDLTISITSNPRMTYIEQAVKPQGEARTEWEIFAAILRRMGELAKARGLESYTGPFGETIRYDELWSRFTMNGHLSTQEDVVREEIAIGEAVGIFPKGTTLETFREHGSIRQQGFGQGFMRHVVANDYDADKPFFSLRWHVDEGRPYPTYARRAQFYIDHPWYLEAGEALPVAKEPPKIGGDHPFYLTGGHPRHSIHSVHLTEKLLMRLHRGQPVMHMNDTVAREHGIADGEMVRVYNDLSDFRIMVRTSPAVQPEQLIIYFWEAYQFPEWKVYDRLLVGFPKPLHLAGGYEQLRYYFYNGSPGPSTDRGVRVNIQKIAQA